VGIAFTAYAHCPVLPATHEAAAAIIVSLNSEEVEWAKYKSNNLVGIDRCD